jgi:hypothetical protein
MDLPLNLLNYELVGAPAGATINGLGVITWTPSEAQGPATNVFTTVVRDSGTPAMSATNQFTVVVREVNTAPVLRAQADRELAELSQLLVTNAATDVDLPLNLLNYELVGAPAGATINGLGVITWTPSEGQGPSTNVFTTVVRDNGTPVLGATNQFTVVVREVNTAPVLPMQVDRELTELSQLVVTNTATDVDLPLNLLIYELVGAPAGATINGLGVITWTPSEGQGPATNVFTTVVRDNGTPELRATNHFTVAIIGSPEMPSLSAEVIGDQFILIWKDTPDVRVEMTDVLAEEWRPLNVPIESNGSTRRLRITVSEERLFFRLVK